MTLPVLIAINASLALAVVAAVAAVVRFAHNLHHEERPETLHPSQPIPLHVALPADETTDLAKAA